MNFSVQSYSIVLTDVQMYMYGVINHGIKIASEANVYGGQELLETLYIYT